MVQLTRIYTKGGDKGKTSLGNGKRVLKSSSRIEAIGAIDEANAAIGIIRSFLTKHSPFTSFLEIIQNDLFDIGADLCMPSSDNSKEAPLRLTQDKVSALEKWIDELNKELSPLTSFVLPGGSTEAAFCHLARTTIRRAERILVHLSQKEPLNPVILQYINRLSDFLFVLGRMLNNKGTADVLWVPGGKNTPL